MGIMSMVKGLFRSEVERTSHHEFGHSMMQVFYHGQLDNIHIGVSGMSGYSSFKPLESDSEYVDVIVGGLVQESIFDGKVPTIERFMKESPYSGDREILRDMGIDDQQIRESIVRVESILSQPKVQEYIKSKVPSLVLERDMSGSEVHFP